MDLRKLDALVAEHVMGWERVDYSDEIFRVHADSEHGPFHVAAPSYSTDIAAAWEVLGKLEADEWEWHHHGSKALGVRIVNLTKGNIQSGELITLRARAKTIEIAICLAALKAKGIDVSEWDKELK